MDIARFFIPYIAGKNKNPILFSDAFARSDGAVGNGWVGATWTLASGKALNTPNISPTELLTDGGLENWDSETALTSWTETLAGTSTLNREGTVIDSGTYALRIDVDASNSLSYIRQTITAVNKWVFVDFKLRTTGGYGNVSLATSATQSPAFAPGATYTEYKTSLRSAATGNALRLLRYNAASKSIYFDTVSAKTLTESELILSRPVCPTSDYVLSVNVATLESGTHAGIVFALDNPANPLNYYIATFCGSDFSGVSLAKVVNGVYTPVISDTNPLPTTVFTANDKITIAKSGANLRIYKNDSLVSVTQTIDAGLVNNLYAGLFSTYSGNQFDNWSEQVKPVGGSSSFVDAFFL